MAETDADLEQDDTETKAEAIGKVLGVEDEEKEDVPDYDVVEDDSENKEDDRLAKTRDKTPKADKADRKQLTSKEKRDLRKKRLAEKFNEKDAAIEELRQEAEALKAWKSQVEGRLSNVDKAKVEEVLSQQIALFDQAEASHAEAFNEGDGIKATKAMRTMYDAQRNIEHLRGLKQQYDKMPPQRQEASAPAPDPAMVNKRGAWLSKNDWYKPETDDEDSAIAYSISAVLTKQGYDPKSNDFWEELDDRLAKRGIGSQDEEDDLEEEPERKPAVRKRAAPPVGGGSQRGDVAGKVKINLPTAYVQALKESGKWEDVPTRNRMIKRYLDGIKQNQAN